MMRCDFKSSFRLICLGPIYFLYICCAAQDYFPSESCARTPLVGYLDDQHHE